MSETSSSETRQRLQRVAWLLDRMIPIPGFRNLRIGLDALIGLIPGIGDAIGALMSSYILAEAVNLNVPKTVLLRMGFNIVIDSLLGIIPLLGDVFDLVWQANYRNVRLLDAYLENPRRVSTTSRLWVWSFGLVLVAIVGCIIVLGFWLLQALWQRLVA